MPSPSTFVLVHGAWHGGWVWDRLAPVLEAEGHQVHAPTLTGLAERKSQLGKDVNLSTHIEDVCRLVIAEDLSDIVLVGHSYGGMVIAGVADRMPERIKSFLVLDGFVPENGKAMREYWPASVMKFLDGEAEKSGGVSVPPLPTESFAVKPENREYIDSRVTPQPYGTFNEAIRFDGGRETVKNQFYVRCLKFRSHPFDAVMKRLDADTAWKKLTIDSGHDAMIDDPLPLAELLKNAV